MTVQEGIRNTARERRARIISTLKSEMSPVTGSNAKALLSALPPVDQMPSDWPDEYNRRAIITNWDIDGIVSSMMLSAVSGWKIAAIIRGSSSVIVHPSFSGLDDVIQRQPGVMGVDVMSTRFPHVSNHVALWGNRYPAGDLAANELVCRMYDQAVRSTPSPVINASIWLGIEASRSDSRWASVPTAMRYKYPLGTAQILLAVLEAIDRSPRLYDYDYLPWLIANCDSGVTTYTTSHYNVPLWWSALAATVGPGSSTEQIYLTVKNQRQDQYRELTHRLRYEWPETDELLGANWKIVTSELDGLARVVSWVSSLSGWPDPFMGGAGALDAWATTSLIGGSLSTKGGALLEPGAVTGTSALARGLRSAILAPYFSATQERKGSFIKWASPE